MKKIAIFSIMALAAALTGCENYDLPNPPGQTNPDVPVFEANNFTVTPEVAADVTVDLANMSADVNYIPVAQYSVTDFPADYTVEFDVEFSGTSDFARKYDLQPVYDTVSDVNEAADGTSDRIVVVGITPAELQGAFNQVVSRAPSAKSVFVRLTPYAVQGDTRYIIGGPANVYGPYEFIVLPQPQNYVIAQEYYLVGTINGWDTATAIKFNHSDKDVYEDPVFKINFEITEQQAADGWWWKIVTRDVVENGWPADPATDLVVGPKDNGESALSGALVSSAAQAGCINEAGQLTLTINMETLTYEFVPGAPYLYTPGNSNGWNQGASQRLFTDDFTNYHGYVYLDGEFKFSNAPDWDHINYGSTGTDGELSTDGGAGNLSAAAGLYYAEVNTDNLTYTLTPITTIGMIGTATPNGWDASTPLAITDDKGLIWSAKVDMKAGEWKLRANDGWDINLGGSIDNLVPNGDNLNTDYTGIKTVTLYLDTLPYMVEVTD